MYFLIANRKDDEPRVLKLSAYDRTDALAALQETAVKAPGVMIDLYEGTLVATTTVAATEKARPKARSRRVMLDQPEAVPVVARKPTDATK